jgi:surface-anchored protein
MSVTRARFVVAYGAFLAVLGGCASADRVAAPGASTRGADPQATPAAVGAASASGVVISQVYGGGGNTGSTYRNDFIELFNAGTSPVTVTGWSVQYASSAGTTWQVTNLNGTIAPGRYYLVQQAAGTGGTQDLPAPDAVGSIAMSATAGKVALVRATAALTGTGCPIAAPIEDFVGYGTGTNCAEGGTPTPAPSNVNAVLRRSGGAQDTDNNANDFTAGLPTPRNSAVGAPVAGPVVTVNVTPATATVGVGSTLALSAIGLDAQGNPSTTTFTWTSSNDAVARVNAAGVVTGVAPSATPVTITATAANGVQGSAAITVSPAGATVITRVTFSTTTTSLPVGFQGQVFANAFTGASTADSVPQAAATRRFEAVNPSVATVDPVTGVFTAVGAGTARFRAVFTPVNGPVFSAEGGTITVEVPVVVDSASTYGNNLEFGVPGPTGGPNALLIRRRQFASSYNGSLGQPNWVSYEYDARQTGGEDRCNCFTTDPLTVAAGLPVVTTADYVGSGYSRGHLARSADRTRTNVENASTFYLSNIVPQIQDQNGGPWATLENLLGDSTRAGRAVYIVTGPQFNTPGNLRYLNDAGKVAIPDSTWKVALIMGRDPATGLPRGVADLRSFDDLAGVTVIAVMMPNISFAQGLNSDWRTYRRTIDQVEAVTGFDFYNLLPDPLENALESGNRPPVPALAGPTSGQVGQALAFSAAGTTDPDAGDQLTYTWTFGDGTTAQGVSVTKSYAAAGAYTVTLTVADRFGWTVRRTQTVTVGEVAVTASLAPAPNYSTTVGVGQTYAVVARFADAAGRAPWRLVIDWGDGTQYAANTSSQGAVTRGKVWSAPGTYTVRFTATASDGTVSAPATITVTVTP